MLMADCNKTYSGQKSTFLENLKEIFRVSIARIPANFISHVGKLLGIIAYALDSRHRRIVRRNLTFTHPDLALEEIREMSLRVFQNFYIHILSIFQVICFSRGDILRKVRIRGKEHFLKALKNPYGRIFISGHLGHWEMVTLVIACYFSQPVVTIARPLQSKTLDMLISHLRTRFGNSVVDKKGAFRKMVRVLRQGGSIGTMIDQATKISEGVLVAFFDRTVTATPAPAMLARRYGCTIVPLFCIREFDGKLTFIVEASPVFQKTDDVNADLKANTQIMTDIIEKAIRSYPDQWFWLHKRWKQFYPDLYPEDMARRRRRREKRNRRLARR